MLKQGFLLLFMVFSLASFSQSNNGSISGTITSVDDEPVDLVSITLVELHKSTLTDTKSKYSYSDIAPGQYTVHIQMIGLKQKDISVDIRAGDVATADYKPTEENIQALQEVKIVRSTGFGTDPNARNGIAGAAFSFLERECQCYCDVRLENMN